MSLLSNVSDNNVYERDPKKVKRQRRNSLAADKERPVAQSERVVGAATLEMRPSPPKQHISPTAVSHSNDGAQGGNTKTLPLPGYAPNSHVPPLMTQRQSKNVMGSPSTTQILRRQSHSRHASFDVNGSINFGDAFGSGGATRRRYSVELPSTIEEAGGVQEKERAPPPPPVWPTDTYEDCSDDSETDTSSSSTDDSSALEEKNTGVKNAKYVFLTLKEALLNSMVIIAFGCLGFCFIEGFSVVDSEYDAACRYPSENEPALTWPHDPFLIGWYFTTVLLTTGTAF
jgi:hypothetical protein